MKCFKLFFNILVIFLKTGNVLSEDNLFSVNNIEISYKSTSNNEILANQAIKKGFKELIDRLLLQEDKSKLNNLNFSQIKELVSYYQIKEKEKDLKIKIFNIFFDKDKLHNLFYKINISYSDLNKNDIFLLPIIKEDGKFFIYSQNYFYEKWNQVYPSDLIEFILQIENIETIQIVNSFKDNLVNLDIRDIFKEYSEENLALILIEKNELNDGKVFLKTNIRGKEINKNLIIKKLGLPEEKFNEKIILETKREIVNLLKSQNLIDIRTPSFINTKFKLGKKNNLVELNKRIKKIDLIENIYVQEFNSNYVYIKIKYLGRVNNIVEELKNQKIILKFLGDQWSLEII